MLKSGAIYYPCGRRQDTDHLSVQPPVSVIKSKHHSHYDLEIIFNKY